MCLFFLYLSIVNHIFKFHVPTVKDMNFHDIITKLILEGLSIGISILHVNAHFC